MSNSNRIILIYVTFPNLQEAKSVSRLIIDEKLAACANILPNMVSVYEWEGQVQEESEVVAIFKTAVENQEAFIKRMLDLHSYTIPAVISLEARSGNPEFLKWVIDQSATAS